MMLHKNHPQIVLLLIYYAVHLKHLQNMYSILLLTMKLPVRKLPTEKKKDLTLFLKLVRYTDSENKPGQWSSKQQII